MQNAEDAGATEVDGLTVVKTTSAWHVEASIRFVESDFGFSGSVVETRLSSLVHEHRGAEVPSRQGGAGHKSQQAARVVRAKALHNAASKFGGDPEQRKADRQPTLASSSRASPSCISLSEA